MSRRGEACQARPGTGGLFYLYLLCGRCSSACPRVSSLPHPLSIQAARQVIGVDAVFVLVAREATNQLERCSFLLLRFPALSFSSPESFGASITPMESLWLKVVSQWVCLLLQVRALRNGWCYVAPDTDQNSLG